MRLVPTLIVAVLIAVPGAGASLALYPPRKLGIVTRLASVMGIGYAVNALVATVLTNLHVMRPVVFFVLLGVVTAGFWLIAILRSGLRLHGRAIWDEIRADPWPLLLGAAIVLVVVVVRLKFSPLINFGHTESWRYWADAQEIARAGRVPASAVHYGMSIPPTVSKLGLNAFNAGVIFAIGSAPLQAMGALSWLVAVGASLSLWAVGREIGLRYLGPLLVILTQAEPRWVANEGNLVVVFHYNAAYVGRMVALCALALGIHAIRTRRRMEIPIVGVVLGMAAASHLIPAVVIIALLFWYAIGHALARRKLLRPLATFAAMVGIAGVLVLGAIATSGGDIGFQGAGGKNRYTNFPPNFDPTLFLAVGIIEQPPILQPAFRERVQQGWYIPPGEVLRDYVDRVLPGSVSMTGAFVAAGIGLLIAALMFWLFPTRLRSLGIVAWGYGASLVIVALGFSYLYETKVPGDFGVRRLIDSIQFAPLILGPALGEGGLWALRRWFRGRLRTIAAVVILTAIAVAYIPMKGPPPNAVNIGRDSVAALSWMRDHLPTDARLVSSRRTAGTFEATLHRVSLTEGMTPFLRPAILKQVIRTLLQARAFFHDPEHQGRFLRRNHVSYVVFIDGLGLGSQGGVLGAPKDAKLDAAPYLRLVYRNPVASVYRVRGA